MNECILLTYFFFVRTDMKWINYKEKKKHAKHDSSYVRRELWE